ELALPGHRALDEPAEEDADAADGHEGQAEHGDLAAAPLLAAAAVAAAAGRAAQYPVADHGDDQDAVQETHQPDVQTHVAVQRVAELVGDDALQLVAGEEVQAPAGHPDHRVAGAEARGEGVDALLRVQPEHRRHGPAR